MGWVADTGHRGPGRTMQLLRRLALLKETHFSQVVWGEGRWSNGNSPAVKENKRRGVGSCCLEETASSRAWQRREDSPSWQKHTLFCRMWSPRKCRLKNTPLQSTRALRVATLPHWSTGLSTQLLPRDLLRPGVAVGPAEPPTPDTYSRDLGSAPTLCFCMDLEFSRSSPVIKRCGCWRKQFTEPPNSLLLLLFVCNRSIREARVWGGCAGAERCSGTTKSPLLAGLTLQGPCTWRGNLRSNPYMLD